MSAVAVFVLTYLLIAARELRFLPLGRPAGALLGAFLMVASGVLTPAESFAAVDCDTILLLFAMMLLAAYLEDAGLFGRISGIALSACRSPAALLTATSLSAAVLSAFLVNDTVCVFMTPIVLMTVRRAGLNPGPFLIALATGANIGSAATLVGNPQNMMIGSMSGYGFAAFAWRCLPAVAAALAVNTALLHVYYGRRLGSVPKADGAECPGHAGGGRIPLEIAVSLCVVAALFAGLHMGYSALAGVLALMVARRRNPAGVFARVDWTLLVFFASLFMVVAGLERTGLVSRAWDGAAPLFGFHDAGGLAAFSAFLAAGSNIVSNVPMTLLSGPHLGVLGNPDLGWPLLGFVTTVAGNLTLVGSVANIIVAERAGEHYRLGYLEYLRFGAVSTVLCLAAGVPLLVLTSA